MTYEEYELGCLEQRQKNAEYLEIFEKDLLNAELGSKTIGRHIDNDW